jgi:hypothetical protein
MAVNSLKLERAILQFEDFHRHMSPGQVMAYLSACTLDLHHNLVHPHQQQVPALALPTEQSCVLPLIRAVWRSCIHNQGCPKQSDSFM